MMRMREKEKIFFRFLLLSAAVTTIRRLRFELLFFFNLFDGYKKFFNFLLFLETLIDLNNFLPFSKDAVATITTKEEKKSEKEIKIKS